MPGVQDPAEGCCAPRLASSAPHPESLRVGPASAQPGSQRAASLQSREAQGHVANSAPSSLGGPSPHAAPRSEQECREGRRAWGRPVCLTQLPRRWRPRSPRPPPTAPPLRPPPPAPAPSQSCALAVGDTHPHSCPGWRLCNPPPTALSPRSPWPALCTSELNTPIEGGVALQARVGMKYSVGQPGTVLGREVVTWPCQIGRAQKEFRTALSSQ